MIANDKRKVSWRKTRHLSVNPPNPPLPKGGWGDLTCGEFLDTEIALTHDYLFRSFPLVDEIPLVPPGIMARCEGTGS